MPVGSGAALLVKVAAVSEWLSEVGGVGGGSGRGEVVNLGVDQA